MFEKIGFKLIAEQGKELNKLKARNVFNTYNKENYINQIQ
jgi:hypothetical protein